MVVWYEYHHFRKPPYMNPMGERLPRDDMSTIFSPNASMSRHVVMSKHRHLQHLRKENSPFGAFGGPFFFGNGRNHSTGK